MAQRSAADTFDRVTKLSQAALADLIMVDMEQLKEKASVRGVTAYLDKPVQRGRPNERFLQNTLRNTGSANRRTQEQQMWAARRSQLNLEQGRARLPMKRSRSRSVTPPRRYNRDTRRSDPASPDSDDGSRSAAGDSAGSSRSGSGSDGEAARQLPSAARHAAEAQLAELLSKRRVRGRGAVGSRVDEPGPYLPIPDSGYVHGSDDDDVAGPRVVAGPAVPLWLRKGSQAAALPLAAPPSAISTSRADRGPAPELCEDTEDAARKRKKEKREKREKKEKKERKNRIKQKEKQKHKQKRERDDG